jgi:tRNA G18 (ribose-2'-O)-methylase SpoU
MPVVRIEDAADDRVRDYRGVSDPDLARRGGWFVAEGRLVVRRLLLDSRFPTRSVLVTEPALAALADVVSARPGLPVFLVPQTLMSGVTGFNIHRGCLAIGERTATVSWQDVVGSIHQEPAAQAGTRRQTLILVLEGVANADNVGGIFRSAAAFGASAILLDAITTDPLYRKAIRTSMGAALKVPFARAEPLLDALDALRRKSVALIGMTPATAAASMADIVTTVAGRPAAIVLGHEGEGLTADSLAACEFLAQIPINTSVDSLNVAAAGAIALYEFRRAEPTRDL